ncbi:type II toxin-antitoxin system HicA family toxin [Stenotrophomonas maltophilia]|uniref:type II toxin-antitoxin system HicA family toxin n=1 Tax=Stenotrophomonas maltophilia TaxID=40324 RepID=UPI0018D4BEA4|nr:type II toxin-antitoxin system HicA family toxin [Stenotrophomonas maltophilia]MBH1544519.1 type II toxin-antitoxin system HicA family toxin [Stenotrophomonas maltophilia]
MKTSEFRRWLLSLGVVMKEGSSHTKLYYNGKQTTLPRHAAELKEGTRKSIIKQLGIKAPPL